MRNMPIMLSLAALACATPLIASDSRDAEIRTRTADAIANLDERGQKLAKIYLKDRVAGDPVYGKAGPHGMLLHAAELSVPRGAKPPVHAIAPTPPRFAAAGFDHPEPNATGPVDTTAPPPATDTASDHG